MAYSCSVPSWDPYWSREKQCRYFFDVELKGVNQVFCDVGFLKSLDDVCFEGCLYVSVCSFVIFSIYSFLSFSIFSSKTQVASLGLNYEKMTLFADLCRLIGTFLFQSKTKKYLLLLFRSQLKRKYFGFIATTCITFGFHVLNVSS